MNLNTKDTVNALRCIVAAEFSLKRTDRFELHPVVNSYPLTRNQMYHV